VTRRRRPAEPGTLPLRAELETLARYYHHLHNEIERTGLESAARRRFEDELLRIRERFDRRLQEWVADEEVRESWRAYLHGRLKAPDGPPAIEPLLFEGIDDAGSLVQIRGRNDEYDVYVDGALQERIAARKDLASTEPVLRFRLNGHEIEETFDSSSEALDALADFVATRTSPWVSRGLPPWEHASELLADGLIDVHFDATPRGRRALAAWKGA
jgi:hypothetical protein